MKPILVTSSIVEQPDTVAPATPSRSHFGVAENLIPAARYLVAGPPAVSPALAFLCAHILECLLKAYLLKAGVSEKKLKKSGQNHALTVFWMEAVALGLPLSQTPPPWAENLDRLHKGPNYYLRYSKGVHAISVPAHEPMISELTQILEVVRARLT
jgi:hypothetical protein